MFKCSNMLELVFLILPLTIYCTLQPIQASEITIPYLRHGDSCCILHRIDLFLHKRNTYYSTFYSNRVHKLTQLMICFVQLLWGMRSITLLPVCSRDGLHLLAALWIWFAWCDCLLNANCKHTLEFVINKIYTVYIFNNNIIIMDYIHKALFIQ